MTPSAYPLTLFYDAACPVCSLEMDHLRERNAEGRLEFIDISASGFDASGWGASLAAMDAELHGLTGDGRMLRGLQVVQLAYEAVGLGWVWRPLRWTPLRPVLDAGYRCFARHRRAISRAASPLVRGIRLLRARRTLERMQACRDGRCDVHVDRPARSDDRS